MSSGYRIGCSLLFLLFYLSLTVSRQIHASHHEQQIACDTEQGAHFHDHKEECHFCDLIFPVTSGPSFFSSGFAPVTFGEYLYPFLPDYFISSPIFSVVSLRAPPSCA